LLAQPVERSGKLVPEQAEVALDAARATDHHMIRAGETLVRHYLARERPEAPFHAVAHDRTANFPGHRETDAHLRIAVAAVAHEQHESRRARAQARVRREEIRALLDRA